MANPVATFFRWVGTKIAEAWAAAETLERINMVLSVVTLAVGVKGFMQARQMLAKGQDILANKTSAGGKIPVIYGTRRVGAQVVYMDVSNNDSRHLFVVYALSVGEVDEILGKTIQLDGNPLTDSARFRYGSYIGSDKISSGSGSLNTVSQVGSTVSAGAGGFGTSPTSRYRITFNLHHGAATQTADPMLVASMPNWTSAHKLNGIAYIAAHYKYDKEGMFAGVPQLTVQVRGKKVYDPRDSGQTFGTVSTYEYSSNPALCFLDFITNNEYGKGLTESQINMSTFSSAANVCDTEVDNPFFGGTSKSLTWSGVAGDSFITIGGSDPNGDWWQNKIGELIDIYDNNGDGVITGKEITDIQRDEFFDQNPLYRVYFNDTLGTNYSSQTTGSSLVKIKRFHCNGYLDTNKNVMENAKELLANMRGIFLYIDGKYELQIEDTGSSSFTITDDHIIADAGISVDYGNKDKKANKVIVEFFNANKRYELDTATVLHDATPNYYSDDNDEILEIKAEFPYVTDPYIAYNMAKAILVRSRKQMTIQFLGTPEMYKLNVGDIVTLNYAGTFDTSQTCRVEALELQPNGLVAVSLIEYFDVYTWETPPEEPLEELANLPSAYAVKAPTGLTFTDSDSSSTDRPILSWTAPTDYPDYEFRVNVVDSSGNQLINRIVNTTEAELNFTPTGSNYVASVTSLNTLGTESDASTLTFSVSTAPVGLGDIRADSVTANTIDVNQLSAISADMGSITAGSIDIGSGAFSVTSAGVLDATGATIGGSFSSGSGNSIFKADTNGIYLGNATFANAPFKVLSSGEVQTTKSFTAGVAGTDAIAKMDGSGDYRFWSGNETPSNASFSVDKDGKVIAKNLVLKLTDGTVYFDSDTGFSSSAISQISANTGTKVSTVSSTFDADTEYEEITVTSTTSVNVSVSIDTNFGGTYGNATENTAIDEAEQKVPENFTLTIEHSSDGGSTYSTVVTDTFTRVNDRQNPKTTPASDEYKINTTVQELFISGGGGVIYLATTTTSLNLGSVDSDGRTTLSYTGLSLSGTTSGTTHRIRASVSTTDTNYDTTNNNVSSTTPRVLSVTDPSGNGFYVDNGSGSTVPPEGDITAVQITTASSSGLTGGANFTSGDATFTLALASSIDGAKTFTNNVVIQGDLDVQGTTTTIDTTNLDVKDKNITLNYGTGDTSANANGAGITIQDAVSAGNDATLTWNTSNDSFNFSHPVNVTGTISSGRLTVDTTAGESAFVSTSNPAGFVRFGQNVGGGNPTDNAGLHIGWNRSNGGREVNMIFNSGATNADGEMIFTAHDGTTYADIFQINGGGNVDIKSGGLRIGTSTVIDSSSNLTNIGTISSGQINATTTADATPAIIATNTGGLNATIQRWVGDAEGMELRNYSSSGDYVFVNNEQDNGFLFYDGVGGVDVLYNGSVVQSWDSLGGTDLVSGDFKVGGTTVLQSSGNNLVNIGAVTATGLISTGSHVQSGDGSGGVALTINDGYGNANVTWNHLSGVPEQTGNAARIEVNTDATSAATMYFELKSGVTSGVAVQTDTIMLIDDTGLEIASGKTIRGNAELTLSANDMDFIVSDTTDTVQNFIWRDHSASKLYLGTANAVATLRSTLDLNSNNITNAGTISSGAITSTGTSEFASLNLGGVTSTGSSFLSGTQRIVSDGYIATQAIYNYSETGAAPAAIVFGNGATYGLDQISLITAGVTRLYIDSAGDVDISGDLTATTIEGYTFPSYPSQSGGLLRSDTSGNLDWTFNTVSSYVDSGDDRVVTSTGSTGIQGEYGLTYNRTDGLQIHNYNGTGGLTSDATLTIGKSNNNSGISELILDSQTSGTIKFQHGTTTDASIGYEGVFSNKLSISCGNGVTFGSSNLETTGTISSGSITVDPSGSYGDGITINAGDTSTATNSNKQIIMAFGGTSSIDYPHSIRTRHNAGADTGNTVEVYLWDYGTDSSSTIGTKRALVLENSTGLDLLTGGYKVGGTTIVDSSRNLTNIGAITSTGAITLNGTLGTWSVDNQGAIMNFSRATANYIKAGSTNGYLVFQTNGANAALTLNAQQNATFAGNITSGANGGIIKEIGSDISLVQGSIGLRINDAASALSPTTNTVNNDAAVDLGVSNIRFRNLYLSGTITSGRIFPAGIDLSIDTGLFNQNAAISYYAASNAVYVNGAGPSGWLRLQAAGTENDYNAINIFGSTSGSKIDFRTGNVQRYRISSSGDLQHGSSSTTIIDSSRNLTNIGTISSGAITSSGASTFSSNVNIDRELRLDARYDGGDGDNVLAFKDSGGDYTIRHNVNDGNGNYSISIGYSGVGSGQYAVTGDGVGKILFGGHGRDGAVSLNAAPTGTAGNNISFSIGLLVDGSDNTIRVGASANGTGMDTAAGTKVFDASANAFATSYSVGSTTVIDASRNLTNIGTGSFAGNVTVNAGSSYPLQVSSTQRYQLQIRNPNNTTNSGYGWWMAHDTNFNFVLHADGAADRFTLTRAGDATITGTIDSGNIYADYSLLGRGFRSANRGELHLNATGATDVAEIFFGYGDGYTDANIRWGISDRGSADDRLIIYRGPYHTGFSEVAYFDASARMVSSYNGYSVNGTTVIDSSRQLTNIAKILGNSATGGTTTFNVGRGDVYFENNGNSNANGAGITLRTSTNPTANTDGSIFDVRSSGQAARLWVGQDLTSAGYNNFYVGRQVVGGEGTPANYEIELNASNGSITAQGNITAYGSVSDIRQKENIEQIDKPIERLEKIKGITFNYKKKTEDERLMGVIAQDLLEDDILKLAVYEQEDFKAEDDDPLKHTYGVRYEHLTAILIEAVKEQQKQIDELKARLDNDSSK